MPAAPSLSPASGTAAEGAGSGAAIRQAGEARSARIESLRALAALAVLLSHAFEYAYGLTPGLTRPILHRVAIQAGFAGVELFFALSGYLLFWPFARSAFQTGEPVDLGRYARNRALRILPLYYLVLVTLLLLQHHGGSFEQWWRFALFLQNFSVHTRNTVDAPMWSLAIEVQFYIALPLVALGLARLPGRSRVLAGLTLVVVAGGSLLLRHFTVWHAMKPELDWQYSLPSVFFFFASGMFLALVRVHWVELPAWIRSLAGRSDAWLLCSVPLWALACWRLQYEWATAIAALLLIGSCVLPLRAGVFVGVTEWRPLASLGIASYSLYLWHVPVMIVLAGGNLTATRGPHFHPSTGRFLYLLAVGAAVCSLVALASYALIEAPPLRLRRRWARSTPDLAER